MSSFYGNHGSIGSGDGLPSVQPTDEGKALIVQNGEWIPGIIDTDELPTVTEDDNGKVLTVVDGEWTAFGSENHQILYNQTIDNWMWSPEENLTQQQLVLQDDSNIIPGNTYLVTVDGVEYTLTTTEDSDHPGIIGLINESGELPFEIIVHQNSNNPTLFLQGDHREDSIDVKIEYIKTKSPLLPEVTDNDNGKILTVVNGEWVAVNNNTELYWEADNSTTWEDDSDTYLATGTPINDLLVDGETYKVTYNGQEYTLIAHEDLQGGGIVLGEYDHQNNDPSFEDYPFYIISFNEDDELGLYVAINDTTAPEDFKIEHIIEHQSLPTVTVVDNGKILKVMDGEWTIVDPNKEEKRDLIFESAVSEYDNNGLADIIIGSYNPGTQPENVDFLFTLGETYIVTFDGVEYELTAEDLIGSDGSALVGENNNYPFSIKDFYQSYDGYLHLRITADDPTTSHDIKIEHVTQTDSIYNCLPKVTDNDNGKILTVINGEWVVADNNTELYWEADNDTNWLNEDNSYFHVSVFVDDVLIIGDTYKVIYNGKEYILTAQEVSEGNGAAYIGSYNPGDNDYPFCVVGDTTISIYVMGQTAPKEFRVEHIIESQNLPTVTAADNGKILQVVNGEWTAAGFSNGITIGNTTITEAQLTALLALLS